jgi:uncharacterized protein YcaQ
METTLSLTAKQARCLHLSAQGLLVPARTRARKQDVLAAIARMQLLQIDTINVVARSPYFVLFSRIGTFQNAWLDELLAEGELFESWAHEACFVPMASYPLHRRHLLDREHWAMRHAWRMHATQRSNMDSLLAHVRENGAVKAADFESKGGGSGGWWGWKDEKRWLEGSFALGELMITRRERFQRVYDLRERVLDKAASRRALGAWWSAAVSNDPAGLPPEAEVRRRFVLDAVRALGVTQARWISDYFRSGRKPKDRDLDTLVDEGELLRVEVAGWDTPGYVHREQRASLLAAAAGTLRASYTTLLSPFDPVVWHRERASTMFGFDYRIECYTPAPKRRYGYFVLPILRRGELVGRVDAKAHRADGLFEVKALYLEPGVRESAALASDIAAALLRCAQWHETPRVLLRRCEPRAFAAGLRSALKNAA